jgi:DNA-binding MarR family transcriptional regulator
MLPDHVGSVFAFCKALTGFYDKFTPKQLAMLLLIAESGEQGISQLTLAKRLGITGGGVSRAVDIFLDEGTGRKDAGVNRSITKPMGLVTKLDKPTMNNQHALALTAKGWQLLANLEKALYGTEKNTPRREANSLVA